MATYHYCKDCHALYACISGKCSDCLENCYMRGKIWDIISFTFKEDDHEGFCPECEGGKQC